MAALVLLAGSPSVPAACKLLKLADLPVTMQGLPLVPVIINGHAVSMAVHTGTPKSFIWAPSALAFDTRVISSTLPGFSDERTEVRIVRVSEFTLAGYTIHNLDMYAVGRGEPSDYAGDLGQDLLSKMDLELDLHADAIRLFSSHGCRGDQVAYWASSYAVVPLALAPADTDWLEADVSVNGQKARAQFETGAVSSYFTTLGAQRLGVMGSAATIAVGQETVQNARLAVADFPWRRSVHTGSFLPRSEYAEPDVVLGMDFLRAHRLYFARQQHKLYFTYAGGPIYQPPAPAPAPAPQATEAPKP